ncbi:MAG: SDR family oxidoreductase [Acidobacteriota bacterium]
MSDAPSGFSSRPVAVVTGGSRGIGLAVAEALLRRAHVVHLCSRSPQQVDKALRELRRRHGEDQVWGRAVDVGDQEQVDAFIAGVQEQSGRIDCLINNAGVGYFASVDEMAGEDWRRLMRTNLDGPFYFTRAVAPLMRERGEGLIVNVASLAGRHGFAGGAAYNASKFGLIGFSEACMLDLRSSGVRVTVILPGSVETEFAGLTGGGSWKLQPQDVAQAIENLLDFPARALPSRLELRPARTG